MSSLLPFDLAPLLEPESLCFGAPPAERKMIVRVAVRDAGSTSYYVALLEELEDGERLRVVDLMLDVVVSLMVRVPDGDSEVCTYVEDIDGELRTMQVAWTRGTATETLAGARLSVA